MPSLNIRHITTYHYRRPVSFGEHRMMFRPRDSHDQKVIEANVEISPDPSSLRFFQDAFGNHVGIARFSSCAKELRFESTVRVEHLPSDVFNLGVEDFPRPFPITYAADEFPDIAHCIERSELDLENKVGCWARQFLPPSSSIQTLEFLVRLSKGIHQGFVYRRREAKGIQRAVETLRLGHGTCRDFAMLMIEASRSLGLAARFASGYLAIARDGDGPADAPSGGDPCLGADLRARRRLDRLRPDARQRRKWRSRDGRRGAKSAPRHASPRHFRRILVGPSRHGGPSQRYLRFAESDLGGLRAHFADGSQPAGLTESVALMARAISEEPPCGSGAKFLNWFSRTAPRPDLAQAARTAFQTAGALLSLMRRGGI